MSAPRRFQLHLSTLLALTGAAGGLLFINLRPTVDDDMAYHAHPTYGATVGATLGWPWDYYSYRVKRDLPMEPMSHVRMSADPPEFKPAPFVADVAVGLFVLALAGAALELLARRGSAPRTGSENVVP